MSAHTPEERTLMTMMEIVLKKLDLISLQIPVRYLIPPEKTGLEKHAPEMFELLKEVERLKAGCHHLELMDLQSRIEPIINKIEGESPHDPDKRDNNQ
jgi:hypothetical protein